MQLGSACHVWTLRFPAGDSAFTPMQEQQLSYYFMLHTCGEPPSLPMPLPVLLDMSQASIAPVQSCRQVAATWAWVSSARWGGQRSGYYLSRAGVWLPVQTQLLFEKTQGATSCPPPREAQGPTSADLA